MLIRTVLAAAVLALSGAAHAQNTGTAQTTPDAMAAPLDDAAFEARAERFEAQIDQMSRELEAAVQGAAGDRTATLSAVDEILARYRPEIDGFADDLDAYLSAQAARAANDPEALGQINAARAAAIPAIRSVPEQIRAGLIQDLDRAAQPPAE